MKPTLAQKKRITDAGLVANNWLVMDESEEELLLVSRNSGRFRSIKKSPPAGKQEGSEKHLTLL